MKKILLALLAVAGLAALSPRAEAGQYTRVYTKHGVVYAPKAYVYGRSYTDRVNSARYYDDSYYSSHRRHHVYYRDTYYAPAYYAPRPVYYRHSHYHHAPRVAFSFGF